MIIIGHVSGYKVLWHQLDQVVLVYGTNIRIIGCRTKAEAVLHAKRNLRSFKEI